MTREIIIKELLARGYEAKVFNTEKMGVKKEGIEISNGCMRPVFYTEEYEKCDDIDYIVNGVIKGYEEIMHNISETKYESFQRFGEGNMQKLNFNFVFSGKEMHIL